MTYGGLWFAWFISFMSGGLVAAVVGTALVFNWIYLPWLNAKDKNQKETIEQIFNLQYKNEQLRTDVTWLANQAKNSKSKL